MAFKYNLLTLSKYNNIVTEIRLYSLTPLNLSMTTIFKESVVIVVFDLRNNT